jgi:hypothetical protein
MLDFTSEFILKANQVLDIDIDNVETEVFDDHIALVFHHDREYAYNFVDENPNLTIMIWNIEFDELVVKLTFPKTRTDEMFEIVISNFVPVP